MGCSYRILEGDVLERLAELPDGSVHCVVTDPPYHLTAGKKGGSGEASLNENSPAGRSRVTTGFMGQAWDGGDIAFRPETWRAVWRVLKPGGYLLAFGGTRTYHRMVCAIEDAGFEIRDQIQWIYGQGFPKSLDVSKAIDKAAGLEITAASTDAAKQWEGWGTALKPAHEPIVVARKPFSGTVAANVLQHGTGALNIDGCRIEGEAVPINKLEKWSGFGQEVRPNYTPTINTQGRWPANVVHDGSEELLAAFPDAPGMCGPVRPDSGTGQKTDGIYGTFATNSNHDPRGDSGSAARFFYTAKADREDRNEGCEEIEPKVFAQSRGAQAALRDGKDEYRGSGDIGLNRFTTRSNCHPTVKPVDLMRWLVRLVTPPGGTVLDCFCGSGSTLKAALLEGFDCIGIDSDPHWCSIARARCEHVIATDMPLLRAAGE